MKKPLSSYAQFLYTYLRPQRGRFLWMVILLLSDIALRLVNPQIMRQFIDTALGDGSQEIIVRLALIFLGIAVVQQVVSVLTTYLSENVGWAATNAMRLDLARHVLNLDLTFHNQHPAGELIERIDGDVNALSNFFSRFMVQVFGNLLLLVGILVLMFVEDWRVGLALTVFTALTVFVVLRFRNIAVPHWKAERQASADLFSFLEERLGGTEDIRANGGRDYVLNRFFRLLRNLLNSSLKASLMLNFLLNSMWTLFSLGTAAAFAVGAWLFQQEIITIGTVYIIFQYTNMLSGPINALSHELGDLQKAAASIARARELLAEQSKLVDSPTPAPWPEDASPLELSFEQVTFGYDDQLPGSKPAAPSATSSGSSSSSDDKLVQEPGKSSSEESGPQAELEKEMVIQEVSFRVAPGAVLGILGRTGSGKTSLTRLIFRLYDPDSGAIRLRPAKCPQSADLRQIPLAQLRRQVGIVTQNIQLFNASVRDNLTFFNPAFSDEQIQQAIAGLGLEDWFAALPKGLDTVLASGEGGLSAGEAQLLAFARIFLRDPGLVILDEASSRLDPATEILVERAITRLITNRTAIIIAHRLATVQRADEILILQAGRVLEHGRREILARDPHSHFYHLLQTGLEEVLA